MKSATWKFAGVLVVSALALAPLSAGASPQPQAGVSNSVARPVAASAAKPSDKTIDDRIEKRVQADPSLKKYDIDVQVEAGVVTLTGTVATRTQKAQAGRLANVTGVSKVDNQLTVDPAVRPSTAKKVEDKVATGAAKTKEGVEIAADKTKEGVEIAVDKTKEGLSKTGEVISDTWITTKVKTTFVGEALLKGSDISAETTDHVVTLSGSVTTAAARARAIALTQKIEGVNRVIDRLTIGPKR